MLELTHHEAMDLSSFDKAGRSGMAMAMALAF